MTKQNVFVSWFNACSQLTEELTSTGAIQSPNQVTHSESLYFRHLPPKPQRKDVINQCLELTLRESSVKVEGRELVPAMLLLFNAELSLC